MIGLSDELLRRLRRIENKVDSVEGMLLDLMESRRFLDFVPAERQGRTEKDMDEIDRETVNVYLLKLPDSLRLTMFAMDKLKEASALEVSKTTDRSRSVESFHLNQLERMGYLVKSRKGKKVHFRIAKPVPKERRESGGISL
jgi:DNA-binding transcriptional ArsR family regulator